MKTCRKPGEAGLGVEFEQHHIAVFYYIFLTFIAGLAGIPGGVFSAQHGSWNRTTPVGARVMFTAVNEDGSVGDTIAFAEGWLDEGTGEYLGRPVDVTQLADGSILVSDDFAGAIYRISYGQ